MDFFIKFWSNEVYLLIFQMCKKYFLSMYMYQFFWTKKQR